MAAAEKKQKIGLWTSTSLVVGNMIGAGVFLMPAAMASFGSISLLGWGFAAIGSFFLAKVFSNLSKLLPGLTGGPYAYSRHGLGDFAGFLIAWAYYISNAAGMAAISVSFISAMSTFFPVLSTNPVADIAVALGSIWFLAYINTLGIITGGAVQLVTTVLKLLPLLLVAVGGLFFIKYHNFLPFNTSHTSAASAISKTAATAMFAFIGLECATVPAGAVENSANTVSKATMLGLFISTAVFIIGSVSVMGIVNQNTLAHSPTPYAVAADVIFGGNARYWVSAGMAIAAFGALNGWTIMQGQLGLGVAKDKLFPKVFTYENKKSVPWFSILINGLLVSVMIAMNYTKGLVDQFTALLTLSVFTTLVPYLFTVAAYPIIKSRKAVKPGMAAAIILGMFAFAYTLWAIAGGGETAVSSGFILLMLGIPLYIWLVVYKKTHQAEDESHL